MFKFANLWLFALLPLPLLIRLLLPTAPAPKTQALLIPFLHRLQQTIRPSSWQFAGIIWRRWLALIIWSLLIFAAASPEWVGAPIELPRSGRDIMLAIDISGSMSTPDMTLGNKRVNRLTLVKSVAHQFVDNREGDRLGLILFGSRAYLQTPLTFDLKTVVHMIDDASVGLAGQQTAIGDAIGLAVKRFANTDAENRVLILLTDGVNNSGVLQPLQAAKIAARRNIRIYTIALGANQMMVNSLFGPQLIKSAKQIDAKSLEEIAKITHGMFFNSKDQQSLLSAYRDIDKLEPTASQASLFHPITALYPWPLALALILSVFLAMAHFRRYVSI